MVNKLRIKEEFCRLVSIDSVSYQEHEMADVLKDYLLQLGFELNEDKCGDFYQGNSGNIYACLEGEIPGAPILLSAHMDTVTPGLHKKAVAHEDGMITSDGTTVLGADDISGIVSILEAIRTIKELSVPHRSIEILFTIAEEVYLRGSEVFDYSVIKAKHGYVLDLDGPVGTAALKAPTVLSFTAKIKGKASHAGFAPELGINAIAVAAQAISQIQQGRIDGETTINIGLIEGGKGKNIVSDECVFKGEVRSLTHDKTLSEVDSIKKVIERVSILNKASYEFESEFVCIAYQVQENHPVVERFNHACEDLGYKSMYVDTFGGSDNNNFHRHGITGLVMSCGMNNVHSCNEFTHIEELVKCSNIIFKLLTDKRE